MTNTKLMNDLMTEIKKWLVNSDTSLAHELTQLRLKLNDIEKISFNGQVDANYQNFDKLESLMHKMNDFRYEFNELCDHMASMISAIRVTSYDRQYFRRAEVCHAMSSTRERELMEKKAIEQALIAQEEQKANAMKTL